MRYIVFGALFVWAIIIPAMGQKMYEDFQDGRIYVKLKQGYNFKTGQTIQPGTLLNQNQLPFAQPLSKAFKIRHLQRAFSKANAKIDLTMVLDFDSIQLVETLIRVLQQDPNVAYAEKIPLDKISTEPNDPLLNNQWYLNRVKASGAWPYAKPGSPIIIAIVDDAVERSHPDLAPNIWVNPGEIPGNGVDDDGNGYIDDINGWDVVNNNPNVDPPANNFDHGTHVAGIASAATNNSIGIASLGYSCKLMILRCAGSDPRSIVNGYQGVLYAANNGAHIINMSWGGTQPSQTAQEIIAFALEKGCILVAAAGNNNNDVKHYPAAYTGVISVASTTQDDSKSSFSNFGEWVTVSAPGSSILSTVTASNYGNKSGTSMASPLVASLLGLMKTLNPGMPNADLIACMLNNSDDISLVNPVYPSQLGRGRINAEAALNCVATTLNRKPTADFVTTTSRVITQDSSVSFADRSSYNPTTWKWLFPGGSPNEFVGKTPPKVTYNTPGMYAVTIIASNAFGSDTLTRANYITVNNPPACVRVNLPLPASWTINLNYASGSGFTNGFVNGTNSIGDLGKAMEFDVSGTQLTGLVGMRIRFGRAFSADPQKQVPIRILDGTSGTPGAELGVVVLTMKQIRDSLLGRPEFQNGFYTLPIPTRILLPASKKFFVAIDLSNLVWTDNVKDSLSILSNLAGQSPGKAIWTRTANGTWLKHGTPGTWGEQFTGYELHIHPYLTSQPAFALLNTKNVEVCLGNLIELSANGSTYTNFQWQLPGANVPVVNNQLVVNPQYQTAGTYKVYIQATGGCGEISRDSGTITINPSPIILVDVSKNPICVGETATITGTGANTYVWSPATGLNTTTGPVVLASPPTTTNYTITGNIGNCTANVPFELEVRARSASVALSASETNISSPTEISFTAFPGNGGLTPAFEFFVNNASVQSGNSNTLVRTVTVNDQIRCEMTSAEPCVDEKRVTSNTITMGETTVPITLLSFSGQQAGTGNRLSWTTGTEQNSRHFVVERSADGRQFSAIGQVAAAGNSVGNLSYNYTDVQPVAGRNFYRLRMVDIDGSFKYSNTILLQAGQQQLLTSLYPNPTPGGNTAILSLTGAPNGRMNIAIANVQGQVIKTYDHNITNGNVQVQLSALALASGNYIIICRNSMGEVVSTQRWTITR